MRRFFVLVLLLASTVGLHAASFEARSPHYAVAIDVVPLGAEDTRYDVRLTDLATSRVLASPQLTAKAGGTADDELHVQGLNVWIHVAEGSRLTLNIEIERDANTIETIQSSWSTRSRTAATKAPDGPLRVGGDVKAPIVIRKVEPVYTEEARSQRIMGIVIVEATIGRDGLVKNATVLKPLPFGLDQAAVDAVKQWQFKPATRNGEPVDVIFNVTINFRLDMKAPDPEKN